MPHSKEPLRAQIIKIREAFRRMRASPWWKANVQGGYAFLEVTHNPERQEWHPHFHIIAWSRYLDFNDLGDNWAHHLKAEQAIVWIKPVKDINKTSKYVTKYLTKGADASVFSNPDILEEYILATDSIHFASTFGVKMHATHQALQQSQAATLIRDTTRALEIGRWVTLGWFDELHRRACRNDPTALEILTKIPSWKRWWETEQTKGVIHDHRKMES